MFYFSSTILSRSDLCFGKIFNKKSRGYCLLFYFAFVMRKASRGSSNKAHASGKRVLHAPCVVVSASPRPHRFCNVSVLFLQGRQDD